MTGVVSFILRNDMPLQVHVSGINIELACYLLYGLIYLLICLKEGKRKKEKKYSKMHKKKGWDIFLDRLEDAITKITIKCEKIEKFIIEKIQWAGKKIF